jgi:hypothetical protein
MNRKWLDGTLMIIGIVVIVGGYLACNSPANNQAEQLTHGTVKAAINIKSSDKSCQQYAGPDYGHLVKNAFPDLSKSAGQQIVWHGQVDGGPPNQKVVVEFPAGQSPFSKDKFDEGQDSGAIKDSAAPGNYPFSTVTVGGTVCSSFSDPGVHVTP